jgi:hypothetical protein
MLGGVCDLCPAELRVRSSWRLGPGSDDEDKEGEEGADSACVLEAFADGDQRAEAGSLEPGAWSWKAGGRDRCWIATAVGRGWGIVVAFRA